VKNSADEDRDSTKELFDVSRGKRMLAYHKNIIKREKRLLKLQWRSSAKIAERKFYTLGGEIFSSVTHGVTALAGVAVLVICVYLAVANSLGALAIFAVSIYGATAFLCFAVSTIYHALAINTGKRVMRVLDHCSIYFLIAGTYTPFSLLGIGGVIGWLIFTVNWVLCAVGTTLTAVDREKYKRFAFVCYMTMGWIAVVAAVPIINAIGFGLTLWMLLAGGVAYTLGAIVFKMKGKYTHGIWHLFTLAGLILQCLSIINLLI
jgi:hemolysin III